MFTKLQVSRVQRSVLNEIPHFKGFDLLRLKDFLDLYAGEIDYDMEIKRKNSKSPYEIICLVDRRKDVKHTMSDSRRRSLRRAGGAKRRRKCCVGVPGSSKIAFALVVVSFEVKVGGGEWRYEEGTKRLKQRERPI